MSDMKKLAEEMPARRGITGELRDQGEHYDDAAGHAHVHFYEDNFVHMCDRIDAVSANLEEENARLFREVQDLVSHRRAIANANLVLIEHLVEYCKVQDPDNVQDMERRQLTIAADVNVLMERLLTFCAGCDAE